MIRSGYDAELRCLNEVLRQAAAVQPGEHVLDIGCGAGQTTREAARAAPGGSALGVDLVAPAATEGLRNVTFEQGDAQVHPFPHGHFDLVMSRFGTMFFADPVAAFTTIGAALKPSGRLVMLVWQARDSNEWAAVIRDAVGAGAGPDPFSLADPAAVRRILEAAGFTGITCTDVREPVYYGPDVPAALDWIHGFSNVHTALGTMDPAAAARADEALLRAVADHLTGDGVWFDSRAWLVTAGRAQPRGTEPAR